MNEKQRYINILTYFKTNGVKGLSKDDVKFFLEFQLDFDKAKHDELKSKKVRGEQLSPEEVDSLTDGLTAAFTLPENKARVLESAQELDTKRTTEKVRTGVGLLLSGVDLVQAQSQINKFKTESAKSVRPARPERLTKDPYLQYAKESAVRERQSPSVAVQAAKTGIEDAYMSDLQNAKIASSGQTGAYGAYAQAATNRKGRRMLELAPVAQGIQQAQNDRIDRLAGLSLQERSAINESAGRYYPTDVNAYQNEQQALAELGQTGFANRRDAMYGLGRSVIGGISPNRRRYTDMYNQIMASYGDPKLAQAAVESEGRINESWSKPYNNELDQLYKLEHKQPYGY